VHEWALIQRIRATCQIADIRIGARLAIGCLVVMRNSDQPTPAPPGARAVTLPSPRLADMTMSDVLLTVPEAAKRAGVSVRTMRR
jgi:hypothetical protein